MLRRKLYDTLLKWKRESAGTTALLIEGARRVGKSYLVERFGQAEYRSMMLIDFSKTPREICDAFESEAYDLDLLFAKLSA
uniref:AAA family ATPase n=1 Tax=Gordonibacter pamelaeae TaxID=471189 RepID=UPI003A90BAF8